MSARIVSYMTREVYTVTPEDTLGHARRLMLSHDISRLPVIGGNQRVIGMLTITDVADALVKKFPNRPANSIYVGEVMSRDVVAVESSKSVKTAAALMLKYNIGGLPVVSPDGVLRGLITRTDLAKYYYERLPGVFLVKDVMRESFARARLDHSIFYIFKLIEVDATGKVLVFDGDKLAGVVTKRDLAFVSTPITYRGGVKYVKLKKPLVYKERIGSARVYMVPLVEDIMTPNPITIDPEEDLARAAEIMFKEGVGVLPVLDEGRVRGVVTKLEILQALISAKKRGRKRL
ncbi:MAG: CBS domain-containing protein [Aeropyrum sp.]|nr:CBS domain-containing protein [Aeropyrum sp.]